MNPPIRSKLGSCFHRQSLVPRSSILVHGTVIENAWPQQCPALFGHDGEIQPWKVGTAASFDITQVEEESQNARSALTIALVGNVVMVCVVELAHFVFQQLKIFRVFGWNIHDPRHALVNTLCYSFVAASLALRAPGIFRGTTRTLDRVKRAIKFAFPHVFRSLVFVLVSQLNQFVAFLVGQKVFKRHDPRTIVVGGLGMNVDRVVRCPRGFQFLLLLFRQRIVRGAIARSRFQNAVKHFVQASRFQRRFRVLQLGTSSVVINQLASVTGSGALRLHVRLVGFAFSNHLPKRAEFVSIFAFLLNLVGQVEYFWRLHVLEGAFHAVQDALSFVSGCNLSFPVRSGTVQYWFVRLGGRRRRRRG
mmetsp:Transcript_6467/g.18203  ORF Transcript_6467/g.18203 Transcript_6467/m.18203 type:complete len:362 (+) Transcript_6467:1196-2281(+)